MSFNLNNLEWLLQELVVCGQVLFKWTISLYYIYSMKGMVINFLSNRDILQ